MTVNLHGAKGFLCKVTPTGRKVFLLYYRTREGRERRPVIGVFGKITYDRAREKAQEWANIVAGGGCPSMEKKQARAMPVMAEFGEEFLTTRRTKIKPRSFSEENRLFRKFILPALGKLPLNSITPRDVIRLHGSLSSTPFQANRAVEVLRQIMKDAEGLGYPSRK